MALYFTCKRRYACVNFSPVISARALKDVYNLHVSG